MSKTRNNARRARKKTSNSQSRTVNSVLPSRFPAAFGDETVVRMHTATILAAPSSAPFVTTGLIVLGKGTSSTGYNFLSSLSTLFNSMATCYTKFMISDLNVEVRATGVGGSSNTFIATSYIPSNSNTDSPPTGLAELSQSNHYTESSLGTIGRFNVKPCQYYNDWRDITDTDDGDKQAGLIQYYGSGSSGDVTIGIITITATIHFCGLRA